MDLYQAIEEQQVDQVRDLLAATTFEGFQSELRYLLDLSGGNLEIIQLITEYEKRCRGSADAVLTWATVENHPDVIRVVGISKNSNYNETMFTAVYHNHIEIVEELLAQGARITAPNIFETAACHSYTQIVEILLEAGVTRNTDVALRHAVRHGDTEIVKLLLDYDPQINLGQAAESLTSYAFEHGYYQILIMVAQRKASLVAIPELRGLTQDQAIEQLVALAIEQELSS